MSSQTSRLDGPSGLQNWLFMCAVNCVKSADVQQTDDLRIEQPRLYIKMKWVSSSVKDDNQHRTLTLQLIINCMDVVKWRQMDDVKCRQNVVKFDVKKDAEKWR